ncbi:porin [Chitinilyticum piscinae]|uniref:Porin n=1 Tax=Chitinilyticum piscinae TaxID=2866724 RepID=A0A8J7FIW1_9NEIS|nr:porin [Chitinilyticum piscinae]MBE9610135.1 porin [Chitinilyticum piscinae]
MQKIIAAAVAAAFLAPAAMAEVTVSGSIRTAIDYVDVDHESEKDPAGKIRIADQSSRIRFAGKDKFDDLGGSLIWQVESGVNVGYGGSAGVFGTRNTFIGYQFADMGTLRFGKYDNAYKNWSGDAIQALDGYFNDDSGYFGGSRIHRRMGDRMDQIVSYESPKWAGFNVRADIDFDQNKTDITNQMSYTIAGAYKHEYFALGAAYARADDREIKPGSVSLKKEKAVEGTSIDGFMIGGSVFIDAFTLSALYERINWDDGKTDYDQDSYSLGLMYKWNKLTFQGAYAVADDVSGKDDSGAKQFTIGARYALSKQTSINLTYANLNNDKNAKFKTEAYYEKGTPSDPLNGSDQQLITLGVRTDF